MTDRQAGRRVRLQTATGAASSAGPQTRSSLRSQGDHLVDGVQVQASDSQNPRLPRPMRAALAPRPAVATLEAGRRA